VKVAGSGPPGDPAEWARRLRRREARQRAERTAEVALDGDWERGALADRLTESLDIEAAQDLASRLVELSPSRPYGTTLDLATLVQALRPLPAGSMLVPYRPQEPPPRQWRWDVPRWETPVDLARALDLTIGELEWLADPGGWNRRAAAPLRHYRYRWIPTRSGGIRLLEAPKPRLAELQRRITRHVLDRIPVHDAAHGFRAGRSVFTCAAPHTGRELVVRMDLEGFFATVTAKRVRNLLEFAGYLPPVAKLLTGLLITAVPQDVLSAAPRRAGDPSRWRLLHALAAPHLPQGAPSSPAVANIAAHHLDVRLAGLARAFDARYTRYADDLAFSGAAGLPLHRLVPGVRRIAREEGFRLNEAKTSAAAAHQRQRVAGLVVNTAPAVPRREYDELRAVLRNCERTGPEAQNRDGRADFRAYLLGRIGWAGAGHPVRAAKLRALFDRITW
jgi:RNA-directed DNA polymerase